MQIDIPWETILKLMLAGAFSYVVAPSLLVLRDLLLWKVIENAIITNKLQLDIDVWSAAQSMLKNTLTKKTEFSLDKKGAIASYMLDDNPVSEEEFDKYINNRRVYEDRVTRLGPKINFKTNLVHWLLKHHKQENESNPVQELVDSSIIRAEASSAKIKALMSSK